MIQDTSRARELGAALEGFETYRPGADRVVELARQQLGMDVAFLSEWRDGQQILRHIVQLAQDLIKVDIGLVRSIDRDPARRALVSSLAHFASETSTQLVAEGMEEPAELETLRGLGVTFGQGYLLGRPSCIPTSVDQQRTRPPAQVAALRNRRANPRAN